MREPLQVNLPMLSRARKREKSRKERKGAAVVEFAICLPVLVAVTFSFIDLTNLIYFRQTIKIAAYDAARKAAEPTASTSDVQVAAARMLQARGIDTHTLTIPQNYSDIARGETIDISLNVPLAEMTSFTGMNLWGNSIGNGISIDLSVVKE